MRIVNVKQNINLNTTSSSQRPSHPHPMFMLLVLDKPADLKLMLTLKYPFYLSLKMLIYNNGVLFSSRPAPPQITSCDNRACYQSHAINQESPSTRDTKTTQTVLN